MTTGEQVPVPAEPCQFNAGRARRKFKRACCCITLLLLINGFLLLHTAHSLCAIGWFLMHGSYTYKDTTYIFQPGGAKAYCNDFCVDICIYQQVGCEMNHCLNSCNQQLEDYGNDDDFNQLPEPIPLVNDEVIVDDVDGNNDYSNGITGNEVLDSMHDKMLVWIDKIKQQKDDYHQRCETNPDGKACGMKLRELKARIASLKQSIKQYNGFAIEIEIDITVQVWVVDIDEVTADP